MAPLPPPIYMKSEPGDPNDRVQLLTERLRRLKESLKEFKDCEHVSGFQLHPSIREEIVKIYEEHGGLSILMQITKVSFNTIKYWYVRYKHNPMFFRQMALHSRCYRQTNGGDKLDVKALLTQGEVYSGAKTVEEMRALLPEDVLTAVDRLKGDLGDEKDLSPHSKLEIARLVVRAGHARPIALLLGLNQKVILSWKGYFAQVVSTMKHQQGADTSGE